MGRRLLDAGRYAVNVAHHADAAQAFAAAARLYVGPATLLGGAHAWRGIADVAAATSRWEDASDALDRAETACRLGLAGPFEPGDGLESPLREALCAILLARADFPLRRGELGIARRRLLAVLPDVRRLGPDGGSPDLWRILARLAEREGRWRAAAMSWRRVAREATGGVTRADALVRLTEVLLTLGHRDAAVDRLSDAEDAARDSMDAPLLGRVQMARATLRDREGDPEAAWLGWERALETLASASGVLQGLARVRMALLAARIRPLEASFLLKEGLRLLIEGSHPDAVGLVHHQLALVALERGKPQVAALAALGAEVARGARSDATRTLLQRAVEQGASADASAMARSEGLAPGEIGTRRGALKLVDQLAERGGAPTAPDGTQPKVVWRDGEIVREQPLPDGVFTVSADADADLQVTGEISLSIRRDASGVRVEVDPFSPQPVLLDGHVIRGEHFLTDGDVLTLGELQLTHIVPPPRPAPRRTPEPAPIAATPPPPPVAPPAPPRPAARVPSRGRVFGGLFVLGVGLLSAVLGGAIGGALVLLFYLA